MISRETLVEFIAVRLGVDGDLDDEELLFSSGLIDSFSLVELIIFIEGEIGSRIKAMEVSLENLDSISRILAFAASRSAEGSDG